MTPEKEEVIHFLEKKDFRVAFLSDDGPCLYTKGNLTIHETLTGPFSVTDEDTGINVPFKNLQDLINKFPYITRPTREEEVFFIQKEGDAADFLIREIDFSKARLSDVITIIRDAGFYSENNSWDPFSKLVIIRNRFETDEEYARSQKAREERNRESKENRYAQYLKLKKEFEGKPPIDL